MAGAIMRHIASALCALFACSCATVMRGTDDKAQFESSPTSANVVVESADAEKLGPFNCVTPCNLELKRKRTWRVDFSLDGYKPVTGLLKPKLSGGGFAAGAGNALIGGLIGVGIDAGTGANMDLFPNPMIAELEPITSTVESRILDAEIINPGADIGEETDSASPGDDVKIDESISETSVIPDIQDVRQNGQNQIAEPGVVSENISLDEHSVEGPTIEPDGQPITSGKIEEIRLYKPGEHAPDDEVSSDLNMQQLEKFKKVVNQ